MDVEPPAAETDSAAPAAASTAAQSFTDLFKRVEVSWRDILPVKRKLRRFDPFGTMAKVVARLQEHKLKKEAEGEQRHQVTVVENHPPYEFTRFFLDEEEIKKAVFAGVRIDTVPLLSVPSKQMKDEMLERRFVMMKHRPLLECGDLPTGATAAPKGDADDEASAPLTLKLAKRVPDVRGPTSAAQVVRAFEQVVVLNVDMGGGEMREEVYSPLRLWTPAARKASPLDANQPTRLTVLCKVYFYIRSVLKEDPASIDTPFGKLRTAAAEWFKGDESVGGDVYFERAVSAYRERSAMPSSSV